MAILLPDTVVKRGLDKSKITPYNHYVLLELTDATMTEGGLHIPLTAQKKHTERTVIAVGPNCKSGVRVGDVVRLHPKHQAIPVDEDNLNLAFLREDHIAGCVNRSPSEDG